MLNSRGWTWLKWEQLYVQSCDVTETMASMDIRGREKICMTYCEVKMGSKLVCFCEIM